MDEVKILNTDVEMIDSTVKNETISLSSEDVQQIKKDPLERKKKIFYDLSADATLHFKKGDSIHINKAMLAYHSFVMTEMFYGPSKKSEITIEEFDYETFKIFLDCLFGFEEYTVINSLLIYPIAQKYEVESSIKSCMKALEPPQSAEEMNENVCLTLNLAIFYDCKSLVQSIMIFIEEEFGIMRLFEKEEYYFLLEPASMLKILRKVIMNSWYLQVVYKWGENYLKNHGKPADGIRNFFIDHEIWPLIPLNVFESFQSLLDFHKKTSQEKLYTSEEVLSCLSMNVSENPCTFPSQSSWVTINKGDILEEKINFKPSLSFVKKSDSTEMTLEIDRNFMIYNYSNVEKEERIVGYEYVYSFQENTTIPLNDHCGTKELKSEVYKFYEGYSDLYRKTYCRLKIKDSKHNIISLDIKYTFHIDCKILKTSLDVIPFAVNDKKLYFTSSIEFF